MKQHARLALFAVSALLCAVASAGSPWSAPPSTATRRPSGSASASVRAACASRGHVPMPCITSAPVRSDGRRLCTRSQVMSRD